MALRASTRRSTRRSSSASGWSPRRRASRMSRAGSLRGYVLIRIALMIPMIWVLLTVVFLMMRVAPGDPISATLGGKLSPADLAERQHALGFDRPLLVQYLDYLWDAVRFKFGTTITDGQTIGSIIVENGGAPRPVAPAG